MANSTHSFRSALHGVQDQPRNTEKKVDEGKEQPVYRIECALERGKYDLEDGGDEVFEGSDK